MKAKKSLHIIVLLVMMAVIMMAYYSYIEKINYNKEIVRLKTNVANMKNTIEDLQEKVNSSLNTIEDLQGKVSSSTNTIEDLQREIYLVSNTKNTSAVSKSNDIKNETPESEIDKIAIDLFEKGSQKIRETEYSDYYEYDIARPVTEKIINGRTYQKRDILYSDVEKKYSEVFTGEALKKVLNIRFAEVDKYLYVMYGGATGWGITNIKVSKVSESNNEIEYLVTYNNVEEDDSLSEEKSCKMILKLANGKYRISETNYLNLNQKN